jgi:hypothetical protein
MRQVAEVIFCLIVFLVALLAVTKRAAYTHSHRSDGEYKHDEDRAVDGALGLFRRAFHGLIAHGASLGKSGRGRQGEDPSQQCPAKFRQHAQCEFLLSRQPYGNPTPLGGGNTRPASGKKKKYMMMKQAVTEVTISQRINAVSNFRCMK